MLENKHEKKEKRKKKNIECVAESFCMALGVWWVVKDVQISIVRVTKSVMIYQSLSVSLLSTVCLRVDIKQDNFPEYMSLKKTNKKQRKEML